MRLAVTRPPVLIRAHRMVSDAPWPRQATVFVRGGLAPDTWAYLPKDHGVLIHLRDSGGHGPLTVKTGLAPLREGFESHRFEQCNVHALVWGLAVPASEPSCSLEPCSPPRRVRGKGMVS